MHLKIECKCITTKNPLRQQDKPAIKEKIKLQNSKIEKDNKTKSSIQKKLEEGTETSTIIRQEHVQTYI